MRLVLALALVTALSSCFSFTIGWERVEPADAVLHENGYRLRLPVGWARSGGHLTRDGAVLQTILFNKVTSSPAADGQASAPLPSEPGFSESLTAEMTQDERFRAVACEPFELEGRRGIRLQFEGRFCPWMWSLHDLVTGAFFPLDSWWRYEARWIECEDGRTWFFFLYGAPPLLYFERDLPTFERLVASLELDAPPAGASPAP